ncbi:MAG: NAD-dependent DNA ligase LigA, partial [Clostridia bacterium]|nr:NAD-dependent DNA ligase LigA [Clostridia bacterium]
MTMQQMVNQLNKWAHEYYVLDNPSVPDTTYDALYDQLVLLEQQTGVVLPDSPTQRVGGEPLKEFVQHAHLQKLYSLDKAQSFNELQVWVDKVTKAVGEVDFSVELKYDGLTICCLYDQGQLIMATTRGNGVVGEVVTEQVKTIKSVPLSIDYKGKIELCGEGYMKLSALERYNQKYPQNALKNARNAAAGSIRNLDPKETAKRNLDVVFYSNGYSDRQFEVTSQMRLVNFLHDNGFKTNAICHKAKGFEQIKQIVQQIADARASLDFLIDGVVIKVDNFEVRNQLGFTDKFPKWAIAYKFDAEQVVTTLNSVDWQVGRTGKLTPTANLEAVELCGATIKRATLNNYGDILRKNLSVGSKVFIRRSNDVIPEVLGLAQLGDSAQQIDKPTQCPACGSRLIERGAHLFCTNTFGCKPQIVSRLTHYCSKNACDIEGLSDKTMEVLVDKLGVTNPADLYDLTQDKFFDEQGNSLLEGFAAKKVANLLDSISKSKAVGLASYVFALGIDNVGSVTAKDLAKAFKSVDALANATMEELLAIDQIGEVVAESIYDFFHDQANLQLIDKLKAHSINPTLQQTTSTGVF